MTFILWGGFITFVLVMLALDLGVINRKAHVVGAREALAWTGVTIVLALGFNVLVYFMYARGWFGLGQVTIAGEVHGLTGAQAATQFFTGWLVEYALSVDNIFVIALIFQYFRVPAQFQHRVLFWGILGALVMRGIMIGAGVALVKQFDWTFYIFGAFLLLTAVKMMMAGDEAPDPEKGWVVRLARWLFRVSPSFEGSRFFTRVDGKFAVTPLFVVVMVVEATDVVFAVDSIPAIIGITQDPFLVFTSNVFAILGLRSLYFALAAIIDKFRYLKTSLVFVLGFIGIKMLGHGVFKIPTEISLLVIGLILALGVLASAFATRRERLNRKPPIEDLAEAAEEAWRRSRRIVILVIGLTLVFIVAPLVGLIPGPGGIAVAIGGLALLATEFVWAARLLRGLKRRAQSLAASTDAMVSKNPRIWLVPIVVLAFGGAIATAIVYEPKWTELIVLGSIGPAIAVAFWAFLTVKRWRALRKGLPATSPARMVVPEPLPLPHEKPAAPPDLHAP